VTNVRHADTVSRRLSDAGKNNCLADKSPTCTAQFSVLFARKTCANVQSACVVHRSVLVWAYTMTATAMRT